MAFIVSIIKSIKKLQYMHIVNHCSFKKLTVSLLSIIFPFHVYLQPLALRVEKKPNKTQNPIKPDKTQKTHPGWAFLKKPGFF